MGVSFSGSSVAPQTTLCAKTMKDSGITNNKGALLGKALRL